MGRSIYYLPHMHQLTDVCSIISWTSIPMLNQRKDVETSCILNVAEVTRLREFGYSGLQSAFFDLAW
jgi:hypothetical protein